MPAPFPDLPQHLSAFSVLGDLPLPVAVVVPQAWQALLGATASERVRLVITLWEQCYAHEFSTLLRVFRQHLVRVEVLAHATDCSLLYVFQNPRGEVLHYLGHAPVAHAQLPATLQGFAWPGRLARFYTHLHNGWYEVVSHAFGLLPLAETFVLSELDWGLLDDLDLPPSFALANVVSVFSSGAGGYLCWDFNQVVPA